MVTKDGEAIVGTVPKFPEVSMHLVVGGELNFIEALVCNGVPHRFSLGTATFLVKLLLSK